MEQNGSKNKYAVKAFSKDYLLGQSKGKESLRNEIDVMRALKHQNIMTLEEVHESQNSIYLIMELLEGGELFTYITEKGTPKVPELINIMRHILSALSYMDSKGLMHRDLKPENMILKYKNSINGLYL